MTSKLIPIMAATAIACAGAVALANIAAGNTFSAKTLPANSGRICGTVVNAVTGEGLAEAYVGAGDFGDSGGSNYSRHRSQGLHDKTKTDQQGRFELDGLAFRDHPLVVTHPEFVRHDQMISR